MRVMGECKFTKGPWEIQPSGPQDQGHWHYWSIIGVNGDITAIGAANQRGPIDMESNQANAHLIAAAPELYEALNDLVIDIFEAGHRANVDEELVGRARDTLAKARGEQQ